MAKGFKDEKGKFRPITNSKGIRKKKEKTVKTTGIKVSMGVRKKRQMIEPDFISMNELRNHPMFEENEEWLDVFANTPEAIVPDDEKGIFYIWFGGESHYIHEYTPFGHEVDVFSCCFEKNKLSMSDVKRLIKNRLNESDDE